ncbi:hypothetical protein GGI12_002722 [Dipsacomyces acuminosporus]|nr:hypothetical protein GGI12_002722 [Dipsacomyces acuminosporus]
MSKTSQHDAESPLNEPAKEDSEPPAKHEYTLEEISQTIINIRDKILKYLDSNNAEDEELRIKLLKDSSSPKTELAFELIAQQIIQLHVVVSEVFAQVKLRDEELTQRMSQELEITRKLRLLVENEIRLKEQQGDKVKKHGTLNEQQEAKIDEPTRLFESFQRWRSEQDKGVASLIKRLENTRLKDTIAAFAKSDHPNLRITFIDKNAYHYHALGAPRALVEEGFGKDLLFRLSDLLQPFEADAAKPKHVFIQGALESISSDNTLTLDTGATLSFDYLVLATGTSSSGPSKLSGASIADAKGELHGLYESVKRAKSILIIGGGAVGVECAGEIAFSYPDKQVTLVHSGPRLFPLNFKPELSQGAVAKLKQVGVKVVLNEKVIIPEHTQFAGSIRPLALRSASGNVYQSDLQILAAGISPKTDYMALLEHELGVSLRNDHGFIKVKPTLQLDAKSLANVFVAGDVNDLPYTAKFAFKAESQGLAAAENIIALIKNGSASKLKEWKDTMTLILVPIGKNLGVTQMFGMTMAGFGISNFVARNMKAKDYFRSRKAKEFPPAA